MFISYCVSFGRLYLSRTGPFLLVYEICGHKYLYFKVDSVHNPYLGLVFWSILRSLSFIWFIWLFTFKVIINIFELVSINSLLQFSICNPCSFVPIFVFHCCYHFCVFFGFNRRFYNSSFCPFLVYQLCFFLFPFFALEFAANIYNYPSLLSNNTVPLHS